MNAEGFDFFGVTPGRVFNGLSAGVAHETTANGDGIALLFIAFEAEGEVMLAEALVGDLDAVVVLLRFEENGSGGGSFYEVVGIGLRGIGGVEKFEDFVGSGRGSGGSETARIGPGKAGGVLAEVMEGTKILPVAEPALIASLTPVGEVLFGDERGIELGGKDFFDGREFVEPGEDSRLLLVRATLF